MSTGLSSLAKLPELGAAYPFAGMEYVFAIGLLGFFALFFLWQIAMEQRHIKKIIGGRRIAGAESPSRWPGLASGPSPFCWIRRGFTPPAPRIGYEAYRAD